LRIARLRRSARSWGGPALCAGLLLAVLPARARAQGVVLGPAGRPVGLRRVRALLVFQERGLLASQSNRPNRQDLLVELELEEPAPAGCRWVLACPPQGCGAAAADPAVLEELSGYWRGSVKLPQKDPWPPLPGGARPEFGPALDSAGLRALLTGRGIRPGADTERLISARGKDAPKYFVTSLPPGARRTGVAHLRSEPLAAVYPGALGARQVAGRRWWLPPTELMVLHTHFINVDDNAWGLKQGYGLDRVYQDPGTLKEGRPLWQATRRALPDRRPGEGQLAVSDMPAVLSLIRRAGPTRSLRLTVLEGRPSNSEAGKLDFPVYSHYPSAVEPAGSWRGPITLGISLVGMVVLARILLGRKGLVQ
jgi:hypothetical protein